MVCPTCMAIRSLLIGAGMTAPVAAAIGKAVGRPVERRVKRKVSAYSKRYGAAFKRLKKKHPRMSFKSLAKKAHAAARRK